MGIYIKGMEMPKGCYDCPLLDGEYGDCKVGATGLYDPYREDCPLTEVPEPNGRLIDADALIPIMKYTTTDNEIGVFPIRIGFDAIKEVIDEAPTVIKRSDNE